MGRKLSPFWQFRKQRALGKSRDEATEIAFDKKKKGKGGKPCRTMKPTSEQ